MRLGAFVAFAALLLAVIAGQNSLLRSTQAETSTPAITACAVQGDGCSQPSLDSTPGIVLSHTVFSGGCADTDLHVMKYVPSSQPAAAPLVATWCT